MTENEAIIELKAVMEEEFQTENQEEAYKMAIQALEKQIAKKPIEKSDRYAWFCPCCDGYIRSTYTRKEIILEEDAYCGRCGQKLDWN